LHLRVTLPVFLPLSALLSFNRIPQVAY
jgi:hypothetical protein